VLSRPTGAHALIASLLRRRNALGEAVRLRVKDVDLRGMVVVREGKGFRQGDDVAEA
jgi:hypothetical protein